MSTLIVTAAAHLASLTRADVKEEIASYSDIWTPWKTRCSTKQERTELPLLQGEGAYTALATSHAITGGWQSLRLTGSIDAS